MPKQNKTDMREIWAQKLREIEEQIRNTMWGDKEHLEYLGVRKEWLEFGFQCCGGEL